MRKAELFARRNFSNSLITLCAAVHIRSNRERLRYSVSKETFLSHWPDDSFLLSSFALVCMYIYVYMCVKRKKRERAIARPELKYFCGEKLFFPVQRTFAIMKFSRSVGKTYRDARKLSEPSFGGYFFFFPLFSLIGVEVCIVR